MSSSESTFSPAVARAWQLLLLVLLAIVSYLALSPTPAPELSLSWDKLNHLGAFAALTVCGLLGFCLHRAGSWRVLLPLFAFGGLIELVQFAVPGRRPDWDDLVADALGMALGAGVAMALARVARWRQARQRALTA